MKIGFLYTAGVTFVLGFGLPVIGDGEMVAELQKASVKLAEKIRPSVVLIDSRRQVNSLPRVIQASSSLTAGHSTATIRKTSPEARRRLLRSLTTGFVIDKAGSVVTLASGLNLPAHLSVRALDGRNLEAKLVGIDPCANIAVLRPVKGTFTPAPVGSSRSLKVGQWVGTVANPFGLQSSVSMGTISGLGRYLETVSACYPDLIQVTNHISPGEMGGALVNLDGEVIGMLCSGFQETGLSSSSGANVGFAIPIDRVLQSARQLIATGKVSAGWLGVTVTEPKDGSPGVVVVRMSPDSPARKSGIKAGDLIVRFNGRAVVGSRGLQALVLSSRPGSIVELTCVGHGGEYARRVQVMEAPSGSARPGGWAGINVRSLTPALRTGYRIKTARGGVIVSDLIQGGPACAGGVRAGDVIVKVGGTTIVSSSDWNDRLYRHAPGEEIDLVVERNGLFLPVKVRLGSMPYGTSYTGSPAGSVSLITRNRHLEGEVNQMRQQLQEMQMQLEQIRRRLDK